MKQRQFDEAANWIGRIDSLINIVFLWHTSPVKTVADAFKTEAKLSGTGVGSTVSIYPTVMNQVLGTKFKLIMGYKGSNDAQLAVERGEVEGHSTSWTALKVGALFGDAEMLPIKGQLVVLAPHAGSG